MLQAHHRPAPVGSGRMKYADPKSLPSYPSLGLRRDDSAATAASLGWANQKPTEAKKTESSKPTSITPSASAAALLAAGSKPTAADASTPSKSNSAGTKAALLAAESVANRSSRSASNQGNFGSSAASQAFKSHPLPRQSGHATPADVKSHAVAQGAVKSPRPRSHSSPTMKPRSSNQSAAAANALNAATLANKTSTSSIKKSDEQRALSAATHAHKPNMTPKKPVEESGVVPTTTLPRSMFTSHPAIGPAAEDQKKDEEMHSSAVAMARRIFLHQQDAAKDTRGELKAGSGAQQKQPVSLQEAAFKLAQERLAKLDQENQKNRAFQDYYGAGSGDPKCRLSMGQKLRRRASSDSEVLDRHGSEVLRRELSLFSRESQLDDKKRQHDRNAVLAAAQRNVKAQLEGMDQSISAQSGKLPSSKPTEWELKAHATAQAKHDAKSGNKGKRDVGGGMYMAQSEIDAIASKRLQPVLDDIHEKAQKERERLAALEAEEEAKRLESERQKIQVREIKENHRKLKEQQKNLERERKQKEKDDERQRKEEERAKKEDDKARKREEKSAKAEQRRFAKEEDRRARELESAKKREERERRRRASNAGSSSGESAEDRDVRIPPVNRSRTSQSGSERSIRRRPSEAEPTSPRGEKVKVWIKRKLSRRQARRPSADHDEALKERRKSFLGGLAFGRVGGRAGTESEASLESASMREVAMAGKEKEVGSPTASAPVTTHQDLESQDGRQPSSPTKKDSVSSLSSGDSFVGASEQIAPTITPPAPIRNPIAAKSVSPTRDSRFKEMVD